MGDRIEVPLDLEDFDVVCSEVVDGTLEVVVRSTRRPACHHCGSLDVHVHQRHERRIRDRACRYPVLLRWAQRRLRCKDCNKTFREQHPEVPGRKRITARFRRRLFERAVALPFVYVAATEAVSNYRVLDAFEAHSHAELDAESEPRPSLIAIDESSFKKRWHYNSVLFDLGKGLPFDMFEGRDQAAVERALLALSPQVRAGIRAVVIDLYWPYRKAVEKVLPDAVVVADKFHVFVAVGRAANRIRRRSGKRPVPVGVRSGKPLSKTHFRRFDPEVYKTRAIFLKRAHELTDDERARLMQLFVRKPDIGVGWLLREEFYAIYDASDRAEAERRLEVWEANLAASGLETMQKMWSKVSNWRAPILAYFDVPITNALAEGLTNKIKVIKRMAYGFRNADRYRRKVLLACRHRGSW